MKETNKKLEEYLKIHLNSRVNRNKELYSKYEEENIEDDNLYFNEIPKEKPSLFKKLIDIVPSFNSSINEYDNCDESYDYEDSNIEYAGSGLQKRKKIFDYEEENKIDNFLKETFDEDNFKTLLFKYIDETGLKDSDIYKKAFIDRRLFNKIKNEDTYHPSKNTVISLGLALNLSIDKFEKLLDSASYTLPKNNYFDLIIRFCIEEKIYNIMEVNTYLYQYNCNTLN